MDEIDSLFEREIKNHQPYDFASDKVNKIEEEFKKLPNDNIEREEHKKQLEAKHKELKAQLNGLKNIKNTKMIQANAKIAEKRKKIRAEIEKVKDILYDISLETKETSTSALTDPVLQKSGVSLV